MLDPRALTKLVLQDGWTVKGTIAEVPAEDIAQAIAEFESVRPLIEIEPKMDATVEGSFCNQLRRWLKPIGMANWPEANWDRGEWLDATMLSLADLPPRVALSATRQAVHIDFRFPNQVKPEIRRIAAEIMERHKLALLRLKLMQAEIERALNPPTPQLEQQPHKWTQEQVDSTNESFRRCGLKVRYRLVGEDVEEYEEAGQLDTGENVTDKPQQG